MLLDERRWGLASILDVQSLFFLLRKNGFAPWPGIMLSQTLIDYWQEIFLLTDVRTWTHPSMIPLHCLWAKSNNTTRGQFECDVTWFCFCFGFVAHMHVLLLFHSLFTCLSCASKADSCKMRTKIWIIIDKKDLITYNSHPWIMLSFNWLVIIRKEGGSFVIGPPRSGGGRTFHGRHICIIF